MIVVEPLRSFTLQPTTSRSWTCSIMVLSGNKVIEFVHSTLHLSAYERGKQFSVTESIRRLTNEIVLESVLPPKIQAGFLMKKSDSNLINRWQKRWFVLYKNRLFYFKDREEHLNLQHLFTDKVAKSNASDEKRDPQIVDSDNNLSLQPQPQPTTTTIPMSSTSDNPSRRCSTDNNTMVIKLIQPDDEDEERLQTLSKHKFFNVSKLSMIRSTRTPYTTLLKFRSGYKTYTIRCCSQDAEKSTIDDQNPKTTDDEIQNHGEIVASDIQQWSNALLKASQYWRMYYTVNPIPKKNSRPPQKKKVHKSPLSNLLPTIDVASNHFICFVPIKNSQTGTVSIWELDGCQPAPIYHGDSLDSDSFLEDCLRIIKKEFIDVVDHLGFNIVALAPTPQNGQKS